ncbi:MAG: DUF5060 domain-containing protein, partial [Cyclobacteriaceae bacterium]
MKIQSLFLNKALLSFLLIFSILTGYAQNATINSEKKANHKLTLTWDGPLVDESSSTYKDYRLEVTFTSPGNKVYKAPGYFAADGKAGESGATNGNKWRAHFVPIEAGKWRYEVAFRTGLNIAVDTSATSGSATAFNGSTGSFIIEDTDKAGLDFRGKGKLQYVGEHFLQFSNGDYFLKVGANSPEVFLEYADFDDTHTGRTYPEHKSNWNSGDPSWKNGKGKEIIGVVNYLSEQGMNTHYFLLMNAYGDGKKAFPWTGADDYYNYDVSKLDQWQIVFDHMMKKGIMPQFVLTEQENQSYFEHKEGGIFADSRKVFYREMVARFGYLNALTWNIGEESGWEKDDTYGKAITAAQRKDFADCLQGLLYYNDHVVVHNGPSDTDAIFSELVGGENYTGISYQGNFENPYYGHDRIAYWRKQSADNGYKWVVSYDEPYTGPEKPDLDTWRKNAVWASFLAGGAGVEFYIGSGKDLTIEDYSLYDSYWVTLKNAHDFFVNNEVPFIQMSAADQ